VNLPQGSNMMWNGNMPLLGVVMAPVTALFGVVVSYNTALVLVLALDGWCTFLWLRRHVRHMSAAWLGGLLMVLGPYASTQATAHILLLLFFPVPLMIIALETVLRHPEHSSLRWGAVIGLLGAAEALLSEEIVILSAIALGSAVAISALVFPRSVRVRVVPLARTFGVAALFFVVVAGVPLAYQLLGPGRITGLVQPPNQFVTDAVNLVVPNGRTALAPPFTRSLVSQWSGGALEGDGYVGIPLLAVSLWAFLRWRGDRWFRTVGWATAAALVWSLGPHLHIDGFEDAVVPLPGWLLGHLPALSNLLPSRFALFVDLGLAAVVAVFADRTVLHAGRRSRLAGGACILLVCATLAPAMPIAAWGGSTPTTPRYFLSGGDVMRLPAGTTALVVPFGAYSELTLAPLLWQAESDFRVRMVSGAIYMEGPDGMSTGLPSAIQVLQHPWSIPSANPSGAGPQSTTTSASADNHGTTIACAMDALEASLSTARCGSGVVARSRADLTALGVRVIIMGPLAYGTGSGQRTPIESFLTELAGAPPSADQGVLVWTYGG
jgi:hypothetical protein